MTIRIREYKKEDVNEAVNIWNQVVEDGEAFPQMELLTEKTGDEFFRGQSFTGIAYDEDTGEIAGLYILHPNNIGRCGHICNASYAVRRDLRGQHTGEKLVTHCMKKGRELGFRILQFNAVVSTNKVAIALYEKLGFTRVGTIPQGFRLLDDSLTDIFIYFHPAPEEKKKVSADAPLPEALDYLRPMYDFIAQKGPVKPEKVAEEFYLGMTSKKFDQLFNAVGERLAAQGLAEAGGPGLLGGRKSFKPVKQAVDQVVELLRAELLEDAPITEDAAALAVLLDQSGCIKTYFSPYERKSIREKRKALSQSETGKLVEDMMCFVEDLVSAMAALTVLNNI